MKRASPRSRAAPGSPTSRIRTATPSRSPKHHVLDRPQAMTPKGDQMNNNLKGNYAEVNGLNMYYEIHGTGQPLVVLHGAYMTIDKSEEVVPELDRKSVV